MDDTDYYSYGFEHVAVVVVLLVGVYVFLHLFDKLVQNEHLYFLINFFFFFSKMRQLHYTVSNYYTYSQSEKRSFFFFMVFVYLYLLSKYQKPLTILCLLVTFIVRKEKKNRMYDY